MYLLVTTRLYPMFDSSPYSFLSQKNLSMHFLIFLFTWVSTKFGFRLKLISIYIILKKYSFLIWVNYIRLF